MSIQIRAEKIIIHDILVNPGDMHKIMEKIDTTMITDPVNKAVFEAITSLYL
jgi:replicative DNA helicase